MLFTFIGIVLVLIGIYLIVKPNTFVSQVSIAENTSKKLVKQVGISRTITLIRLAGIVIFLLGILFIFY